MAAQPPQRSRPIQKPRDPRPDMFGVNLRQILSDDDIDLIYQANRHQGVGRKEFRRIFRQLPDEDIYDLIEQQEIIEFHLECWQMANSKNGAYDGPPVLITPALITPGFHTPRMLCMTTAGWRRKKRPPAGTVSVIPVPPLSASRFGLIQEDLANDPFKLLVAVTFLNKTKGVAAIPVFYILTEKYPTPEALSLAEIMDVASIMYSLGLQNQRAKKLINLAKLWMEAPPAKGKRYRTINYPTPEDSKGIKASEILTDEDERLGAWEVAHLPSCGPYAIDSWRIFCRDKLRGLAEGYNGQGASGTFQPEWQRVLPKDKELRAYLRWMWLKEGWLWNPLTGEKEVASAEFLKRAEAGNIVWEEYYTESSDHEGPSAMNIGA